MAEYFVKCPWCAGTGRNDAIEVPFDIQDCSTALIPDERKCDKCKGVCWVALSRLELKEIQND